MKTMGYDECRARRLVPLLRSIVREICERRAGIEELELRLERLSSLHARGPEFYDVQARLSANRRELRLAQKELSRLGCELDPVLPTRVHIPGDDGDLEHGFTWVVDEETACTVPQGVAG